MKLLLGLVFVILATTQIVHAVEEEISDEDMAEMNRENHYFNKDKTSDSYQAKDSDKIDERIKNQEADQPFSGDKYVAPPPPKKAAPMAAKKKLDKIAKPKKKPAKAAAADSSGAGTSSEPSKQ